MTTRDVRDPLIRSFEGIVERHGVPRSKSHACALELLVALRGQGISTLRPALADDPNANWRPRPGQQIARPADTDPDDLYYAARLFVTGNPPAGAPPPPEGAQLEIPID